MSLCGLQILICYCALLICTVMSFFYYVFLLLEFKSFTTTTTTMLEQWDQGIKELTLLRHQSNAANARKESKRMTVLRLGPKNVNFGFMVPVLTSPRKKLNSLELNAIVCGFVTRVSSRITISSLLQKQKLSCMTYLIP